MYIPKYYQVTDPEEFREFIEAHSFGTIITSGTGRPLATHLPLQLKKNTTALSFVAIFHPAIRNGLRLKTRVKYWLPSKGHPPS
ncbi:hypothetical protein AY633_16145 [Planococcus maritimus]|nr:FMN-binding negative transcriptional regulator [Planococcus maritimus]KYG57925.1 hypothetical protein AY633_16145 [Planococcus maritimus]